MESEWDLMMLETLSLANVFDGWDTYQTSIVHAVAPLTKEQLLYRPAPSLRSVGEVASHIGLGRIGWFQCMHAPGSAELAAQAAAQESQAGIAQDPAEIVKWLEASWQMIELTLKSWTVADLARTYLHTYYGKTYAISYQWTIWRILAHDMHHGGELAVMLGMQGIAIPELGDLGGHLTEPPLADSL
jgi:uncharacterized damage-inducible protein DinB